MTAQENDPYAWLEDVHGAKPLQWVVEQNKKSLGALKADPRAKNGLQVHVENVLDTDFIRLRGTGEPLRVVGNLPYNISTPLLFRLLAQRAAISEMYFMLQKEVVERMVAQLAIVKENLRQAIQQKNAGGAAGDRRYA